MATGALQLPIHGETGCMICKVKPPPKETLTCSTCVTPWHVACLTSPPENPDFTDTWECPDCCGDVMAPPAAVANGINIVAAIKAIDADQSLSHTEKAKKKQELLTGKVTEEEEKKMEEEEKAKNENHVLKALDSKLNCSFCMQLPERPVTTPCGHSFCLKCFQKWVRQGKNTCAKCRQLIPAKMASNPRINSALVVAIRMAKMARSNSTAGPIKVYQFVHNQDRPDKAYTTERAKKTGKANACSGKIFVTIAPDHLGPILAENDPIRNQGVLVGETWEDRLECRQWGAHLPHVAGIAGQSSFGAQSVALSGGYEDDEDHGEWFLYTGSGGRDLSGNKRTNKAQSFDQKFEKSNEALRLSCKKGYPVRVVRSHKEKRSAYAPVSGVRYDGIYRIEKCWRKIGIQGFKVCRYLFVRCDNEPAPWTSDEHGDRPRPLPAIPELKNATDVTERTKSPSWDFEEKEGVWKWKMPPPPSQKPLGKNCGNPEETKRLRKAFKSSVEKCLLKEFSCQICDQVMTLPMSTPCGHNFCKPCLDAAFDGKTFVTERSRGGRTLRVQKNVLKCPACPVDISEYLQNAQVNRELLGVIESLKTQQQENEKEAHGDSSDNEEAVVENPETGSSNEEEANGDSGDSEEAVVENSETDSSNNEVKMKNADPEILADVENPETDLSSNGTDEEKMENADSKILDEGETKRASKRQKLVAGGTKQVNEATVAEDGRMKNADPEVLAEGKTKRGRKRLNPAAEGTKQVKDSTLAENGKAKKARTEILAEEKTRRTSPRLKLAAEGTNRG